MILLSGLLALLGLARVRRRSPSRLPTLPQVNTHSDLFCSYMCSCMRRMDGGYILIYYKLPGKRLTHSQRA
jgi:hypothetical protein